MVHSLRPFTRALIKQLDHLGIVFALLLLRQTTHPILVHLTPEVPQPVVLLIGTTIRSPTVACFRVHLQVSVHNMAVEPAKLGDFGTTPRTYDLDVDARDLFACIRASRLLDFTSHIEPTQLVTVGLQMLADPFDAHREGDSA